MKKNGQTITFNEKISILSTASITGPKEAQGPINKYFDKSTEDMLFDEASWEKAESKYAKEALSLAITKAKLVPQLIDFVLAGDLLNQETGSTFGVRGFDIPLIGLYSACATFGSCLANAAILIDGDFADHVLVGASSHFCTAEKQFRYPLELGTQRTPTSQWTVTGDGACVISRNPNGPFIKSATIGKIIDLGIKDANNMGAAMAPAAADTIITHLKDTGRQPDYYDAIITGDLGYVGQELLIDLVKQAGYDISKNHSDCGIIIFDRETQDTHAGGSGCACSAVTFASYIYSLLKKGQLQKVLFIPTGALLSTVSSQQGETIPGIAHAVCIETI